MKRTKVRCPICNKLRVTRSVHFRCCNKQHITSENLASKIEIEPKIEKGDKVVATGQVSKDSANLKDLVVPNKNKVDLKDLGTPNNVTITYKDEETGEAIFQSDNCMVFEGTWKTGTEQEAEVVMDVDRGVEKSNPQNTNNPQTTPVTDNPSPELKQPIWDNKLVQGLAVAAAGVGLTYWLNNRKSKTNSGTDW